MIKLLSLFSGIGAFEKALRNIGEPFKIVNYCENDRYASKAYTLIHSVDESINLGDITRLETDNIHDEIDMITYGFPCQDISNAGKQKGFTDEQGNLTRSGLFFEALRIIEDVQPKIAIAENVKALVSKKFTAEFKIVLQSLNEAGYENYWAVLNARDYGIPQNRERVFIISIRKDVDHGFIFPEKFERELMLKDMLEQQVDDKYYINDRSIRLYFPTGYDPEIITHGNKAFIDADEIVVINATKRGCIEAREGDYVNLQFPASNTRRARVIKQCSGTLQTNDGNGVVLREDFGLTIRKFTPKEDMRLMGFDDHDCDVLRENEFSDSQIYKLAGNSIVVDVLEEIFVELLNQYSNVFPMESAVS